MAWHVGSLKSKPVRPTVMETASRHASGLVDSIIERNKEDVFKAEGDGEKKRMRIFEKLC